MKNSSLFIWLFQIFFVPLQHNKNKLRIMDKKIFLLDKEQYTKEQIDNLTEKDLEEWVAEEDYDDNYSIIKIDANGYASVDKAIDGEMSMLDKEDYYIRSFGF